MNRPNEKIAELTDISAGYHRHVVLREINLTVYPNDFIGIIGPNGGGKTTLIKLLTGELKPFSGTIKFYPSGSKPRIGYLPQSEQLDRRFPITVTDVVVSGLLNKRGLLGKYGKEQHRKAHELLDMVGISSLRDRSIGELSGGQLQRTLLCRALISDPQLLILDEPNTYVDNKFEGELYELLRELNSRMAIIMVSHDLGTITSYVKTIACVNGTLFYHESSHITPEQLAVYNCPIQLITHGQVPHSVLLEHNHSKAKE